MASTAHKESAPDRGALLRGLESAIRRHMLLELPVDPTATLRTLDFRSLHTVYATWRLRIPRSIPRRLHLSREFLAKAEACVDRDGVLAVVQEIASGANLRPRVSTAVEHAYRLEPPPRLARRPHKGRQYDGLLADWGIHHLHLGTAPHANQPQFVARTGQVLFVVFRASHAYLVDLEAHESHGANWSALSILEIIVRTWPTAGIVVPTITDLRLIDGNWTDEERRELRMSGRAGGIVEVDGRVWVAGGGGQSAAGNPMAVIQHCMATSWKLAGYDPSEQDVRRELPAMAVKHQLSDPAWEPIVEGDSFGYFCDGLFVEYGTLLPSW